MGNMPGLLCNSLNQYSMSCKYNDNQVDRIGSHLGLLQQYGTAQ